MTRALQRLRLLGLWQHLRRVATSFLQPIRRAIMRIVHSVERGGAGGSGTVRRQQMVLVLASIVMMVLYGQSDRL